MKKVSVPICNDFCPQTLFLYGTYKEDGKPNFGLFCWFSYYFDSEVGVMACIGGEKQTKDCIRKTKVFSANLVTEKLLPLADYLGNTDGRNEDKSAVPMNIGKGEKLNVPVLLDSPWTFELEVDREIDTDDGYVMLCKIRNILADENLRDGGRSIPEMIETIRPVRTTFTTYYGWDGKPIGKWGEVQR